ncbi:hypothetical protein [Pedobacter heparinus]|uniref:hypothetical protein n=1 Tax=Pedobacter heparinus TaxID=984 RepID=UPI00292E24FE|nr:hypothetical protein [Pedobacter heparinus]
MNNIKKVAFGMLVAGLAFGFSAFTTVKKRNVMVYYKFDMTYPNANDPRGYRYYSGDMCAPGGNTCSAQWDIGTHQFPGDGDTLPTTGVIFQTGSVYPGHLDL